ncbi:MAG: hypothetical protein DWQ47_07160 [Acidobacteria bacterium]|nr:MAG: hypothetical protein DWQ32_15260 [Acidobacteriota bacterium]REJ99295.1 MAG: hypothetical protein DWQ38_14715 [Acidobacteriota bacterium]REK15985.1 MAG: hypothetical protein DWQ43_02970 [Acidobacteriota bacterium]REK43666.1 MAG: hypothetical protein DWQ47_07160 [Acidobacteriota bacterium]
MLDWTMGLDLVEIVMRTEEEFDIEISDPEAEAIKTPGELINFVKTRPEVVRQELKEEEIRNRIWSILEDELGIKREEWTDNSRFIEDMNAG